MVHIQQLTMVSNDNDDEPANMAVRKKKMLTDHYFVNMSLT